MINRMKFLGILIVGMLFVVSCKKDDKISVSVERVTLSKTSLELEEGKTAELTAIVFPKEASNKAISWASSNQAVAIVDENGKVTAVKEGNATIVVTTEDGKKTAKCEVTVIAKQIPVESVTLSKKNLELEESETAELTTVILPKNASNKAVFWESSNQTVATVDENGKVTAIKEGNATIVVTTEDGKKTAKCEVTIVAKQIPVESVTLNRKNLELEESETVELTATVLPENASNKAIFWESSNQAVATVDENGKVTAVKLGNAIITATTKDGNKTTTCEVTVLDLSDLLNNGFTDSRDNAHYKVVKIGNQVWMAENLKYLPSVVGAGTGSKTEAYYYVYGYDGTDVAAAKQTNNYKTYGVLYNWTAAMNGAASSDANPSGVQGVCPTGWHLPSDIEWTKLTNHLGGENVAGGKLKEKETTHWDDPNIGATNESGFTALPGGSRGRNGSFSYVGNIGNWWSSTQFLSSNALGRYLGHYYARVNGNLVTKDNGFSVRCVRD